MSVQQTIDFERDMLNGNLNRMCVTDDKNELKNCCEYAMENIRRIFKVNEQRLIEEEEE